MGLISRKDENKFFRFEPSRRSPKTQSGEKPMSSFRVEVTIDRLPLTTGE